MRRLSFMGTLYYGDNLDILKRYIEKETVDLIYLDPPFNSAQNYSAFFQEKDGTASASQIRAFEDTWTWNQESQLVYEELILQPGKVSEVMQAFKTFLGTNDMMAYLAMMCPRLVELRRVLKFTGSLYLHCDPTASHYLKLLLDAVFGQKSFRNEIIWCYETGGRAKKFFPRKHDVLFYYAKSENYLFNYDEVALPRDTSTMHEPVLEDEHGKPYQRNFKAGKEYRYYLDKGVLPNDWWTDIQALNPAAKERLGYPTQKPTALIERIIKASSKAGDMVLDPFCGCGTTIDAAEKLGRKWIGIDVTQLATSLIKSRLRDTYGSKLEIITFGEPTTPNEAGTLAEEDKYQFQWWALGLVGARPVEQKKGADHGIDGKILFRDDPRAAKPEQIIIQVKGGKTGVKDVRDLRGVLDREKAAIGVLISLQDSTGPMDAEAASLGFYEHKMNKQKFPRLQLRTVKELMEGKGIERPTSAASFDDTFKKAPASKKKQGEQTELGV